MQTREPVWTILKVLQWTTSYFKSLRIEGPRMAAEILLAHALGLSRIDLYLRYDQPLSAEELAEYKALIKRRAKREPVAYIVGSKEFWSMELAVTTDVLIPRPETECLVEQAIERMPGVGQDIVWNVLELGTGSGAIILALAAERPQNRYFASDRSEKALRIAGKNAEKHGLADSVRFFVGDWFAPLKPEASFFNLIVSNPPYVAAGEISGLEPEVRDYEPRFALDGGSDGLASLSLLIGRASAFLKSGGYLILEMGYDQAAGVESAAKNEKAFESVEIVKDYAGLDRLAIMKKRGTAVG